MTKGLLDVSKRSEVLRLFVETNLTYRQIAEAVGVCKSTVANIIRRHTRPRRMFVGQDYLAWKKTK